jgi:neopullulanase
MKFKFLIVLTFLLQGTVSADDQKVSRIEPPFWWTGMADPQLQLLIYGKDISLTTPEINHPGIVLADISKVTNPDYLFLNLEISRDIPPGIVDLVFKKGRETYYTAHYELKGRKAGSANRKGFDKSDVIYLLMPDRFSNGDSTNDNISEMMEKCDRSDPDGRHGGDIQGIINHLDYIRDLGFTALWPNPLVENNNPVYSYHGYAITNFYKIDPRFGTNSDYLRLVNESHKRGIKVIMDMVFNHCSIYHWMMQDLPAVDWLHTHDEFYKSNFRASVVPDPYVSDYDREKMLTGWFDTHMADLDQRNELLAKYLIQNSIWWIEFSGIDGIRIDTQPYSYKNFLTQWSNAVFAEYPKFNVVGETWLQQEAITSYFQKDAMNRDSYNSGIPSVTDFPLYYAINKAFNEKDTWTDGLLSLYYVLAQDFLYSRPDNNLIFVDNHDLDRFSTKINSNLKKWKMGMGFLLTTRGIPCIYYGTEIMMTGEESKGHGFIRQDFPGGWKGDLVNAFVAEGRTKEQNDAYNFLKELLKWRKNSKVIQTGKLKHFIPEDEIYVYFRYTDEHCIMVALNNSNNEMKALKTGRFSECMKDYKYAKNMITGEVINYLNAFTLAPKSILILDLKK